MEIIKKIPVFSFYYVVPLIHGFTMGLCFRDNQTINVNKKISMSLADYYAEIHEDVSAEINNEFPEVEKLLKKLEKNNKI